MSTFPLFAPPLLVERMKYASALLLAASFFTPQSLAQTGTLDQVSPYASEVPGGQSASFNFDTSWLTWQASVFAGMDGILEGVEFEVTGLTGATVNVAIFLGSPWQAGTPIWSGVLTKTNDLTELLFADTTAANIALSTGDAYTILINGTDQGMWGTGSFESPVNSFYGPELWLSAAVFGPEWRIGLHTWMVGGGLKLSTPGAPGGFMALFVSGATPAGPVAYLFAFRTGSYSMTHPPPGNVLTTGLSSVGITVQATPTADVAGNYSLGANVPSGAGGLVCVQVVDLLSDGLSNVVCL
ncbi:MAG: hypothetical protein H8E15_13045 [Planctomycetes bacterium]|nr:hypothetical protein [Planctomycetota bacterium]